MDLTLATELWAVFTGLTTIHQITMIVIAFTIGGFGFAIGRWSAAYTRAQVELENSILKNKIGAIGKREEQEKLPPVETLSFERGVYYEPNTDMKLVLEGHEISDGPFCPRCWEVDRVRVSLQKKGHEFFCVNKPCGFAAEAHDRKKSGMKMRLSRTIQ